MAKLARAVHLRDPQRNRDIVFEPGEEPAPEYAILITNPNCWEGGKLPAAVKRHLAAQSNTSDSGTSQNSEQEQEGNDPDADSGDGSGPDSDDADTSDDKPASRAAAKKTAARKPAASQ
ncbi:hypothetical protein [Streptomyces cinereoruber]|uniref:hypothetical protein n=1 Tax=Streptomyces cinereoruber TaxID=67260 RepID=UPI00363AE052